MKKIKELYKTLLQSHTNPKEVAFGMALGVFISFTPTLGFHSLMACFFALVLNKSKIAALLGAWVVNPITIVPFYYLTYKTGLLVTGAKPAIEINTSNLNHLFHLGKHILIPLWWGSLIVGVPIAIISYFITLKVYPVLKKKQEQISSKIKSHL